jgi:hypothetical protein
MSAFCSNIWISDVSPFVHTENITVKQGLAVGCRSIVIVGLLKKGLFIRFSTGFVYPLIRIFDL